MKRVLPAHMVAAPLHEYVEKRIERAEPPGCWMWTGTRDRSGYGVVRRNVGGTRFAHRVMWVLTYGEFDRSLCVCHHCDTPACVNPAHLFLGTAADNAADKCRKGRAKGPRFLGETNPKARLTADKVAAIRADERPVPRIAVAFGVCQATVRNVKSRRHWRHVP